MKARKLVAIIISLIMITVLFTGCKKRVFPPEKVVITGYGAQNPVKEEKKAEPVKQPVVTAPENRWYDMDVTAVGNGAPPANAINESQAKNMAKRAAKMDALRNLAETVKGVQVDSKTKVVDFMTQSDEINSRVNMFIQGSQVLEEKQLDDGTYEVKVGMNLKPLSEYIKPAQETVQQPVETVDAKPSTVKPAVSPQQAKLMAQRAATMDARRNLLEYVKGVQIDSKTKVVDYMTQSDSISSEREGMVKGARVIATRWNDDGTCEVDVEFDLANVKKLIK